MATKKAKPAKKATKKAAPKKAAKKAAHKSDLIFVGGSTFVVADVLGVYL